MPQVNVQVAEFNLKDDMSSYYRGTYVTYKGAPAYVHNVLGRGSNIQFEATIYSEDGTPANEPIVRNVNDFDLILPPLGFVKFDNVWYHLSRNPQRRMRKGYGEDMIRAVAVRNEFNHCSVTHPIVLKQIWFGNTERVSPDCIIIERSIYFQGDEVATVDPEGNIIPTIGKEKLGEFVCKLLAANWDNLSSKHSHLTLNL